MMGRPMWWWLAVVSAIALGAVLAYWGASAIWVKIISDRWNAMTREENDQL